MLVIWNRSQASSRSLTSIFFKDPGLKPGSFGLVAVSGVIWPVGDHCKQASRVKPVCNL